MGKAFRAAVAFLALATAGTGGPILAAQMLRPTAGVTRKVATVTALARFPFFFHGQPVRVRGMATERQGLFQLEHDAAHVWLVPGGTGKLPEAGKDAEVTGTYYIY